MQGQRENDTQLSGKPRPAGAPRYLHILLVLGLFAGMLALASPAQAQLPSICAEYPDDPSCDVGPTSFDVPPAGDLGPEGLAGGANLAGSGDGAGGELPFTGYPVNPLILFALLLLLLGIGARIIAHASRRARETSASA